MSRICIIGALVASAFAFAAGTTASAQSDDVRHGKSEVFSGLQQTTTSPPPLPPARVRSMFNSDNEWAYVERCSAYDGLGNYTAGLADCTHAIVLDPKDENAFANALRRPGQSGKLRRRARRLQSGGRAQRRRMRAPMSRVARYSTIWAPIAPPITDCTQAITLDPKIGERLRSIAASPMTARTLTTRQSPITIRRSRFQSEGRVAYFSRGNAYKYKGDYTHAIADYTTAINLNPKDRRQLQRPLLHQCHLGQAQAALADCDQALQLRPNDANTLDSRGYTYLKLGQFDSAIADYNAALKLNPRLATSLYGRGVAELKKRQPPPAKPTWPRPRRSSPTSPPRWPRSA